jgi:hypothetical protein
MLASTRFSLRELASGDPSQEYKRRLLMDGAPTECVLYGDSLYAQFACGSVSLVITSYDHYEAVSHWFYVMSSTANILDEASTPDYFGFLDRVAVAGPAHLGFGFYGTNDQWHAVVHEAGIWSFAKLDFRLRMNRFLLSKRYISFSCEAEASPRRNA